MGRARKASTAGRSAAGPRLADPAFKLDETFARFRKGYRPAHFAKAEDVSVRGSRRGEMIARCVVESGTSSYYTAIKDATDEPVLKEIAGRIAADEFRHYKLFYETLHKQEEPELPFWRKLLDRGGPHARNPTTTNSPMPITAPPSRRSRRRPRPISARAYRQGGIQRPRCASIAGATSES